MLSEDVSGLVQHAAQAAWDKKAFQLVALDVTGMTSLADSFLICSGAHERQVGAIAEAIRRRLREHGRHPLHVEGERRSEWILLDYGDVVIHVFTEEKRAYYALEGLWGQAKRLVLRERPGGSGPDSAG
ncbi:MAG: ribosome silencing factor [Acidobacteria bacterium]|nr:ribosome silencing factor [Acidobacteriota bacterium]